MSARLEVPPIIKLMFSLMSQRILKFVIKWHAVESRKVFHLCVLTEPYVKVSLHTALPVYKSQMYCYIMDVPIASVEINGVFLVL